MNRAYTPGQGRDTMWSDIAKLKWVVLTALTLWLSIYNLNGYPRTWYDEGMFLQVPKNLVHYGVYGLNHGGKFVPFDPYIGSGPALLLPIAVAFKLLGVGLLQARSLMVVYLLLLLVVVAWLTRDLYGPGAAWLAVLFVISSPFALAFEGTLWLGRQVMGEMPTLVYLLVGIKLWMEAERRGQPVLLMLSGLSLGLGMLTRLHYLLPLLVSFSVLFIRGWQRTGRWWQPRYLVPMVLVSACVLAWEGYKLYVLGPATFREHWRLAGVVSSVTVFAFSVASMLAKVKVFGPQLTAVVLTLFLFLRQRQKLTDGERLLSLLMVFSLGWYFFASIGWPRYAFVPVTCSYLFLGWLIQSYAGQVLQAIRQQAEGRSQRMPVLVAPTLVVGLVLALAAEQMGIYVWRMYSQADQSPQVLADYLDRYIPADALIESWEMEINFLTDHLYHFPPVPVQAAAVRYTFLGQGYPSDVYDPWEEDIEFLVYGPSARLTDIYTHQPVGVRMELLATVGEYRVYRVLKQPRDQ